jgi:hypothetical protein
LTQIKTCFRRLNPVSVKSPKKGKEVIISHWAGARPGRVGALSSSSDVAFLTRLALNYCTMLIVTNYQLGTMLNKWIHSSSHMWFGGMRPLSEGRSVLLMVCRQEL